jgi:hypothetical protein
MAALTSKRRAAFRGTNKNKKKRAKIGGIGQIAKKSPRDVK